MKSFYQRHKPGIWTVGVIIVVVILGYLGLSLLATSGVQEPTGASFAPNNQQSYQATLDRGRANNDTANDSADSFDVSERQVIRNGSLELVVGDIDAIAQRIQDLAERTGGFVASSRIADNAKQATDGSITIRVPADSFRNTIQELKGYAVRTTFERTEARDVTDRLTDLQARLRNAQRTEQQYLSIMEQANSIDNILKVQERISEIRERIERLEANQQQLERQVQLATIHIDLVAEEDVEVAGVAWSPLNEIKAGFNKMMDGLINFLNMIISVLFALPVLALWLSFILAILAAVWKGGWWLKRQVFD